MGPLTDGWSKRSRRLLCIPPSNAFAYGERAFLTARELIDRNCINEGPRISRVPSHAAGSVVRPFHLCCSLNELDDATLSECESEREQAGWSADTRANDH